MQDLDIQGTMDFFNKIDPFSVVACTIIVGYFVYKHAGSISSLAENFVLGKIFKSKMKDDSEAEAKEKEKERQEILDAIGELKDEISSLKGIVKESNSDQANLHKEFNEFKDEIHGKVNDIGDSIDHVSSTAEFLMNADKEDKKAFIIGQYNQFVMEEGKIDIYSKDTLEKIYDIYLKENGDTFVASMMTSIRNLPLVPQIQNIKHKSDNE